MAKVFQVSIGATFGRLTVSSKFKRVVGKQIHWFCFCVCVCGSTEVEVRLSKLGTHTKSCGCLRNELYAKGGSNKRHGLYNSRTYNSWRGMLERTTNPNNIGYRTYHKHAPDSYWHEFINFLVDMGEAPENTTLDRIDTKLPYSRENCRWADLYTQNRNKVNNIWLTHRVYGDRVITDACRIEGIPLETVRYRLHKQHKSMSSALPGWEYKQI